MGEMLSVKDVDVSGKRVIVRADLDVPVALKRDEIKIFTEVKILSDNRIKVWMPTVTNILKRGAKLIVICGHLDDEVTSASLMETISKLSGEHAVHWPDIPPYKEWLPEDEGKIQLLENLRMNLGEKENDNELAAKIANFGDIYVNEAFATSHRVHASIDALPRIMKSEGKVVCVGDRFAKEIEMLGKVFSQSKSQRRILVIGGAKVADKEKYAQELAEKFDMVLKGGLLQGSPKRKDGLDITDEAIESYKKEIANAEVIVAAGVMGKYEGSQVTNPKSQELGKNDPARGTYEVLSAIANSRAYKVAGGGDIEAAISKYGLSDKFDWISVGGGAMLEYLARGTLPGIEALNNP